MKLHYGLNFAYIHRKDLLSEFKKIHPYKTCIWEKPLLNHDIIYNGAFELIYVLDDDAYRLMDPDPSHYLPYETIFKRWTYR